MHLSFVIPPPNLRTGGLDTAIDLLKQALESEPGVRVTCDTETPHPGADFVHFHGLWMPSHMRAYRHCQRMGIPYSVSPHGMLEPWALRSKAWKKWPYLKLLEAANLRRSRAIFVTSPLEAGNVRTVTSCERIRELPLGLSEEIAPAREEARSRLGLRDDDRVLLYLSRIDPKKGLDHLLESVLDLDTGGRWQLWIVGEDTDPWAVELKRWSASRMRRLPPVRWLGPHWGDAKWPYFQAADLFCLPTHSENFGMAVLEALWVGTPVLTTPDTPWADYAGVDGIQITHNDPSSLRQALEGHFHNDTWTTEQRDRLRAWTRNGFHWNQLRGRYLTAYDDLIALVA